MKRISRLYLGLTALLLALQLMAPATIRAELAGSGTQHVQVVRVAVRAHRGAAHALQRWGPTMAYLSEHLPGYRFQMVPFENVSALNEAISRDEFDFVLASPASYVEYEMRHGVRFLATVINERGGHGYTQFGSVIFTRADRDDINTLEDLRGKSFMGVSEQGFGGWRVAWYELRKHGLDPYRDFSHIMFAGGIQPRVVTAVAEGAADAGTVRTDMLERMAAAGVIALSDFKILNPQHSPGFPFAHSTALYPEWPFARCAHTDDELAERVARVLLGIAPDAAAARAGHYVGWHTPLDYTPVKDLLRTLGVGPFTGGGSITFPRLLAEYGLWITLGLVVVIGLCLLLLRMKLLNDRLRATEHQLKDMAMRDGLTGLANRHQLDRFLARSWKQAIRSKLPVSAVLFDIDQFKEYNDHYGHVSGDECLRQVANATAAAFKRATDLVVRYGGEEFLVILVDTGPDSARSQAETLRARIAELRMPHAASAASGHVTVSVGVASCVPTRDTVPQQLIAAADAAVYRAKAAGRNCVVITNCGGQPSAVPRAATE